MPKRDRITLDQAREAYEAYQQIPIRFLEVDVQQAMVHADRLSVYAYDAYVIEASLQQRCPFLTLDRGLIHAAVEAGAEVLKVSASSRH